MCTSPGHLGHVAEQRVPGRPGDELTAPSRWAKARATVLSHIYAGICIPGLEPRPVEEGSAPPAPGTPARSDAHRRAGIRCRRTVAAALACGVLLNDPIPEYKAVLARAITERLTGWSQEMAAALIGVDQPRMSNLRSGKLENFSLAQLIRFAARLGATVSLGVTWPQGWWNRPRPPRSGRAIQRRRRDAALPPSQDPEPRSP